MRSFPLRMCEFYWKGTLPVLDKAICFLAVFCCEHLISGELPHKDHCAPTHAFFLEGFSLGYEALPWNPLKASLKTSSVLCLGFYSLVSSSTERSSNVTAPMRTSKRSKSLTASTQLENQLQNVTKQLSCSKEAPWRNSSNTLETGSGRQLSLIWSHWGVWEKAGAGKMALGLKSPFWLNMNTEVQASGSQGKVI